MLDCCDRLIVAIANYILDNKCTVRQCAKTFGVSKSAVHSYVNTKLKDIDIDLYKEVRQVLEYNLSVRHLRGGESTKRRYKKINVEEQSE